MCTEEQASKEKEAYIPSYLKEILKAQLIWYLINFLIIFFQLYVAFDIPLLNNIYILIFKIIGHSLFISFLLYWTTMIYNLSFHELGINFKNFIANTSLAINISLFLLSGAIIINLTITNSKITPLIYIKDVNSFNQSLIYFILLFICYLIPAFSKELFYRGFIQYYFKEEYGVIIGSIISILYYTFSYLDIRLTSILLHFLIGFITTYLYEKTDSLITSVIFQATYQASLSLYLFSFEKWPF
ncbi:CPBP family intramembrane glutamic endopeptidase [Orenia marismortui]|uniref:CPBP family intramembrane glutamic endopeptidase n=1 Tax=Orenia marismortui TaxID=46469 RepID=UPI0003682C03|nr:CPBP family intramembrane glutamic endopeptidase [Orenia marismortui]